MVSQEERYCQIEFVFRVKHQGKIENVKIDVRDCCLGKIGIGKFVIRDGHLLSKHVLEQDVVNAQHFFLSVMSIFSSP